MPPQAVPKNGTAALTPTPGPAAIVKRPTRYVTPGVTPGCVHGSSNEYFAPHRRGEKLRQPLSPVRFKRHKATMHACRRGVIGGVPILAWTLREAGPACPAQGATDRQRRQKGAFMNRTIRDVEIATAIDSDLLRRREQFAGQPAAWRVWSEAAHVATLNERARIAFIEHVAASRGADIALRLLMKAQSIREQVTQALLLSETQATLH